MSACRILVGGVPFGCNNVGDEAILECVVAILRAARPDASITVSTADGPATATKLGVQTVPLYGFEEPYSWSEVAATMARHDVFVWSGATGLSDYPEEALRLLRTAQTAGCRTILWGVGMNDQLNPAKYTLLPGRKRRLCECVTRCAAGLVNAVDVVERHRCARARRCIVEGLSRADLVVLRDPESRDQVLACGEVSRVLVGADSALELRSAELAEVVLSEDVRTLLRSDRPKVGICISAQREVAARRQLVAYLDGVVAGGADILFVPMNPLTDSELMVGLHAQMAQPGRAAVLAGRYEPAEVLAVGAHLDVVVSSRLHLLILCSIAHIPLVGIGRGSKVQNFLNPFGLRAAGSVEDCDFQLLERETARLLRGREAFATRSRRVREDLLARLEAAKTELEKVLASV